MMNNTDVEMMRLREKQHSLGNEINTVKCRTELMEKKMQEMTALKTEFEVLKTKVTSWMDTTTEYRKSLCCKLDKLTEKLEKLPCKERREMYRSYDRALMYLKIAIAFAIALIVGHLGWR